ncbi:hypothetical protein C8J57DRAFT_1650910 [Mycena rebaudengoi]|nr:hypothetical protein C8J57DRAFT_1650910 [Mycena rebaudengoi]
MSDPNCPSIAQPPDGVHYDIDGKGWCPNTNGTWVPHNPMPPDYDHSMRLSSSTAAASTSHSINTGFELRLPPLPDSDDGNLTDPTTIAHARGLRPAKKVAGARRKTKETKEKKGKGKEKAKKRRYVVDSGDDSDEPVAKRGRPSGSGNYSKEDQKVLLDLIEEELPLGHKGWAVIEAMFNDYARKAGRPERAGTRDLDDSDFDEAAADDSSSDVELIERPTHDDERSQRSLHTTQLLAVNQQLRDSQATIESLRSQITIMTGRVHDVERARDRAELLLEIADIGGRRDSRGRSRSTARHEKKNKKQIRYSDNDSDKENLDTSFDPVASSSSRDFFAGSTRPRSHSTVGANYLAFPSSLSPLGPLALVNDTVYPSLSGPGVKPSDDAD